MTNDLCNGRDGPQPFEAVLDLCSALSNIVIESGFAI
jgi:hypothetical protein